jgi:iron(III) transport system substrate-binding protein
MRHHPATTRPARHQAAGTSTYRVAPRICRPYVVPMTMRQRATAGVGLAVLALLAGCADPGEATGSGDTLTLYTCVSDTTIQPVIEAFQEAYPGSSIDLYRAPTGDMNARVAGDVRSGGLRADVIWACDPLTMQDYADQGLVGGWTPRTDIPQRFRTDDYVGVAVLYMLAVNHRDVASPSRWSDLTRPPYADAGVAVPDPSFAASALGTVGYFAQDPSVGMEFYSALADNGAVQVSTPNDVVTGVAEGMYSAGITIANSAYAAQDAGSPIEVAWPEPGAIAIYGPVALSKDAADNQAAKDFLSYVTSEEGQRLISASGSYPTLETVPTPTMPADAPVVFPNWSELAGERERLLDEYRQIFQE